jgi:hypothetical protein
VQEKEKEKRRGRELAGLKLEKRRRVSATAVRPRHKHATPPPRHGPAFPTADLLLNPDGDFSFFDLDFP